MTNRYLEGAFRPAGQGIHPHRSDVVGDPGLPGRALPAQRSQPDRPDRTPSATTGSPATAWCTACGCGTVRPSGTAKPLRPRPAGLPGAGEPEGPVQAVDTGRQHQRDRPRRPHPGPGRGRHRPVRAHRRAGHRRGVGLCGTCPAVTAPTPSGTRKPRSCMPLRTAWNAGTPCSTR